MKAKRFNSTFHLLLIPVLAMCITSCRVNHGLKIISPELGGSLNTLYPGIDSLQPTLCWKAKTAKPDERYTYDVAIYKGNPDSKVFKKAKSKKADGKTKLYYRGLKKQSQNWGTLVYLRDSLEQPCHLVETPLEPNTYYTWAVQLRSSKKVHGWSYLNFHRFYGLASGIIKFVPYGFVTPAK